MKKLLFLFLVTALASAAPADKEPPKILKSAFDLDPSGSYQFGFDTEDLIHREETGEVKSVKNEEGKEEKVVVVQGRFSYSLPTGEKFEVIYTADENGFQPIGTHLPTEPEVAGKTRKTRDLGGANQILRLFIPRTRGGMPGFDLNTLISFLGPVIQVLSQIFR